MEGEAAAAEGAQGDENPLEDGLDDDLADDLDEDDLRSTLGLKKAKPGSPILSRYGPLGVQGFMMGGAGAQPNVGDNPGGNQPGGIMSNPTVLPGNLKPGDAVANPVNGQGIPPQNNLLLQALMATMGGR